MAVIQTGSIVDDIRGSVGAETYGRNQGGLYVRTRTGPAGPPSADQDKSTAAITALSQYWSATLTDQQRDDWRKYAHQHPRPNRWGTLTITNGYNRFIAHNARIYRITTAVTYPSAPSRPPIHPPVFIIEEALSTEWVTIDMTLANYLPADVDLYVQAYFGINVSPGVNFYAGPWMYAGFNICTAPDTWASDPWMLFHPGDLIKDDKLWMRFIIHELSGGAMSTYHQNSILITDPPA